MVWCASSLQAEKKFNGHLLSNEGCTMETGSRRLVARDPYRADQFYRTYWVIRAEGLDLPENMEDVTGDMTDIAVVKVYNSIGGTSADDICWGDSYGNLEDSWGNIGNEDEDEDEDSEHSWESAIDPDDALGAIGDTTTYRDMSMPWERKRRRVYLPYDEVSEENETPAEWRGDIGLDWGRDFDASTGRLRFRLPAAVSGCVTVRGARIDDLSETLPGLEELLPCGMGTSRLSFDGCSFGYDGFLVDAAALLPDGAKAMAVSLVDCDTPGRIYSAGFGGRLKLTVRLKKDQRLEIQCGDPSTAYVRIDGPNDAGSAEADVSGAGRIDELVADGQAVETGDAEIGKLTIKVGGRGSAGRCLFPALMRAADGGRLPARFELLCPPDGVELPVPAPKAEYLRRIFAGVSRLSLLPGDRKDFGRLDVGDDIEAAGAETLDGCADSEPFRAFMEKQSHADRAGVFVRAAAAGKGFGPDGRFAASSVPAAGFGKAVARSASGRYGIRASEDGEVGSFGADGFPADPPDGETLYMKIDDLDRETAEAVLKAFPRQKFVLKATVPEPRLRRIGPGWDNAGELDIGKSGLAVPLTVAGQRGMRISLDGPLAGEGAVTAEGCVFYGAIGHYSVKYAEDCALEDPGTYGGRATRYADLPAGRRLAVRYAGDCPKLTVRFNSGTRDVSVEAPNSNVDLDEYDAGRNGPLKAECRRLVAWGAADMSFLAPGSKAGEVVVRTPAGGLAALLRSAAVSPFKGPLHVSVRGKFESFAAAGVREPFDARIRFSFDDKDPPAEIKERFEDAGKAEGVWEGDPEDRRTYRPKAEFAEGGLYSPKPAETDESEIARLAGRWAADGLV